MRIGSRRTHGDGVQARACTHTEDRACVHFHRRARRNCKVAYMQGVKLSPARGPIREREYLDIDPRCNSEFLPPWRRFEGETRVLPYPGLFGWISLGVTPSTGWINEVSRRPPRLIRCCSARVFSFDTSSVMRVTIGRDQMELLWFTLD